MTTNRISTSRLSTLALTLALTAASTAAYAADPTDEVVSGAQRARGGAGLQVSSWQPDAPAGLSHSETAAFQGYLQKGLDMHLAWENTLGYWQRTTSWSETQPLIGTTNHQLQTHLVPMVTALRVYPLTKPGFPVEPFMSAGVGPVLGIQQQRTTGGLTPGNTTSMLTGLGVRAGAGVDLRAGPAFGITVGGHFESASFGQDMVGDRLYQGWGVDAGLSYRFQYH